MGAMNQYEYYLNMRLDGKYYCSIHQHGIPGPIAFTGDFDTEEEATEAADEIVQGLQSNHEKEE
jgi:hypothetical protein